MRYRLWLIRHPIWAVALLVEKLPSQCWSRLVDWVYGNRRSLWSPITNECRADAARAGACYCGKLREPAPADGEARL